MMLSHCCGSFDGFHTINMNIIVSCTVIISIIRKSQKGIRSDWNFVFLGLVSGVEDVRDDLNTAFIFSPIQDNLMVSLQCMLE